MSVIAANPFLQNVHSLQFKERVGRYVRPLAIRPFNGQKILALKSFEQFEQAVLDRMGSIAKLDKAVGPVGLCENAFLGKPCPKGAKCNEAGSLVDLYAKNIILYPLYKSKLCKFGDRCTYGTKCLYGHSGDIMRKVVIVGNQVFTEWFYLKKSSL